MDDHAERKQSIFPAVLSQKREIRLLNLLPGVDDDELHCRLSVVSLDSNPSYEALSYCWGDEVTTILIENTRVTIPRNLKDALRRIRLSNSERIVWADAICINQSCIPERNEQVAMMADIYRSCDRCIIWLGSTAEFDETDDIISGDLPEFLSALSQKHHLNQAGAPTFSYMFGLTRIGLMYMNLASWWTRIWVVQEVVLSPNCVLIYGALEMPFSEVLRAVEFIDEHDMVSVWDSNGRDADQLFCRCMDRIKVTFIWADLLELRDHVFRLLKISRNESEGSIKSAITGQREFRDLLSVLLSTRHRDSTDPRDKVFGVLSLVERWSPLHQINADYSKDAAQVFRDFAAQMIQSIYGARTLILACGTRNVSREVTALPSWVPDWTQKGSEHESYLLTKSMESAQPAIRGSILIAGDTLVLNRAVSLGKIEELSTPGVELHKSYGQAASMEAYNEFCQMIDEWRLFVGVKDAVTFASVLDRHSGGSEHPQAVEKPAGSATLKAFMADLERSERTADFVPETRDYMAEILKYQDILCCMDLEEEAFYHTLIHDTYPVHFRNSEQHQEALCTLRLLFIFYNTFADPDRFLTRLNSVILTKMSETLEMVQISTKRMFRTSGGQLGIGPEESIVGDEIFLFEGVQCPFVLRPVKMRPVESKGDQPCYELVGTCYIDDLKTEDMNKRSGIEIRLQ